MRGLVHAGVMAPFFMSPFIGALAWGLLLSPKVGVLNHLLAAFGVGPLDIYTLGGIIWVMGLYYAPYVYTFVQSAPVQPGPGPRRGRLHERPVAGPDRRARQPAAGGPGCPVRRAADLRGRGRPVRCAGAARNAGAHQRSDHLHLRSHAHNAVALQSFGGVVGDPARDRLCRCLAAGPHHARPQLHDRGRQNRADQGLRARAHALAGVDAGDAVPRVVDDPAAGHAPLCFAGAVLFGQHSIRRADTSPLCRPVRQQSDCAPGARQYNDSSGRNRHRCGGARRRRQLDPAAHQELVSQRG